ncbi:hypothetical protein [Labilibaculum euxinus]|uniref:Uncharacterized protein n=1 Tax=Labilibaculum euxinus TaxID=2686357 RepID=A0A7M4D2K5_9BACT|nr:hypothetical protein [Labilibaculum euxinus]MUP36884.1 hypothetical protein [Labilibaculum euxinus]MVB06089.1 hypothetical protein [Labilibaculum euxinus]
MSNKENFDALLSKYQAYVKNEVKEPNQPVDIAIDEAMDLSVIADKDRELLATSDLDVSLIDDLPIRAGGLRYAQTVWVQVQTDRSDAEEQWKHLSVEAFEMRDELLHFCRYAYRKNSKLMDVVNRIAEGYGNADMVQDLSDLAMLGTNNPEPLAGLNYPMEKLERASELSDLCGALLAKVNGARVDNDKPAKEMRDRAFTHVKQAVDAIREAGRFVFWKDEQRVEQYTSAYFRKLREAREKKVVEEA